MIAVCKKSRKKYALTLARPLIVTELKYLESPFNCASSLPPIVRIMNSSWDEMQEVGLKLEELI